jgi:hypothetical protein
VIAVPNAQLREPDTSPERDDFRVALWSTRTIRPHEEIVWCYGTHYHRSYATSCSGSK